MGKDNKDTSLSEEEKGLILEMKQELQMMGVPRDQWAEYIQRELTFRRTQKRSSHKSGKSTGIIGFFKTIWDKILGFFFKLTAKRFTKDDQTLEQLQQMFEGNYQPSEEEKQFMDMMNPQLEFDNVDDLGKGGATISHKEKQKKMIVEFDDEDFE